MSWIVVAMAAGFEVPSPFEAILSARAIPTKDEVGAIDETFARLEGPQ